MFRQHRDKKNMKILKIVLHYLQSGYISQLVLFLNLVVVLMITFHFESLNLLLKIEISSLQNDIANIQLSLEQLNVLTENPQGLEKDYFFVKNEKQIATIAVITIAVLFFTCKILGAGYVPDVHRDLSDLNESVTIVNSDAAEVLAPFEQETDLFDRVELQDKHIEYVTKTQYRNLSMIERKIQKFVEISGSLSRKTEVLLKKMTERFK